MAKNFPWYKWRHEDWFESDTRATLTYAERGLYREVLDIINAFGSISSDPEIVRLKTQGRQEDFDAAWPAVAKLLDPHPSEPGRLIHHRAFELWREREDYLQRQSVNGSKGGRKTHRLSEPKAVANPPLKRALSHRDREEDKNMGVMVPNGTIPPKSDQSAREPDSGYRADEGFERWYALCLAQSPENAPRRHLETAWSEIVTSAEIEERVIAGFTAWTLGARWQHGIVKRFDRWLLDLDFERPPKPKSQGKKFDPYAYSNGADAPPQYGFPGRR